MNHAVHNTIVSFIWGIADDILRDVYVRGKYRDVILPMTVIRRLDAVLESTKEEVLNVKKKLDASKISNQDAALRQMSGQAFHNTSPFTLKDLKSRAKKQQLKQDFEAYLDGFSPNVQEILDKFKFRNQIPTMIDADILANVIEKFLDPTINLSSEPVYDSNGTEKLPALDNHAMGTIFEELIRRFNEENNEEAGEHFTPRDIISLMANLIFYPVTDDIESGTYLVYDGACGTGGMLTVAEKTLTELAKKHGKDVSIHLYGQEINAEHYAISKADLLLKGEGEEAENIKYGSTLSADGFPNVKFDFMLSNPPYGKSWKIDLERLGGKRDFYDPRFIVGHEGNPEFSLITRSSDGQLMFLVNKLSKLKHTTSMGSRIAEVHNGSSLFTGDAGQGESNIRRYIIENDWLEAIIAVPENMFYNTGIATYIWLITNRKAEHRKGKVQLIDATQWHTPLRKNLGKKNCEFTEEHIQKITDLLLSFKENEQSKIFPNKAFGYWRITVERPLRLKIDLSPRMVQKFTATCEKAKEKKLPKIVDQTAAKIGPGPHLDFNIFIQNIESAAEENNVKLKATQMKLLASEFAVRDESAKSVIKRICKTDQPNPLYGIFETEINGKRCVVEYEPDTSLRDIEQVPLLEDGGIEVFFKREVSPYAPDAWIDESKNQIGCEISFTKYFYKPAPLRTLAEIKADIISLKRETEGILEDIVKENK